MNILLTFQLSNSNSNSYGLAVIMCLRFGGKELLQTSPGFTGSVKKVRGRLTVLCSWPNIAAQTPGTTTSNMDLTRIETRDKKYLSFVSHGTFVEWLKMGQQIK